MKRIKIRKGLFETNSSSTHAIYIAKESSKICIPDMLYITPKPYGWEKKILLSEEDKLSYLFSALIDLKKESYIWQILSFFSTLEIEHICYVEIEKKHLIRQRKENEPFSYKTSCYEATIDHSQELTKFIDYLFPNGELDKDKILNFTFSPNSFIKTWNDNDSEDDWKNFINMDLDYPYDKFYKGN